MITRAIPRTGEQVPVIGLGSWQTFDVGASARERAPLVEVVRRLLAGGGRVIDSSPMYGRAEERIGDVLADLGAIGAPFVATKVWTRGRAAGIAELERSMRRLRAPRIDLVQIHNLLDWETHLPVLREWKAAGRIRYLGITHYAHGAFDELERLMRTEALDFVQLPYSAGDRAAEARLLPAARDTGTAVLVMRPLGEGALVRRLARTPLPAFARELGARSWATLLLQWIVAHPDVTCAIPATADPAHLDENVAAGAGPLPDPAMREAIAGAVR